MNEKSGLAVWNVKDKQFPKNGHTSSKLKYLIRYAILASSGFNSQPWKFKVTNNTIEVWADKDRRRPTIDPFDRELYISLGCAVANLEIAAKYFGLIFEKEYIETRDDDRVAIFRFSSGKTVGEDKDLFKAIPKRRVNREDYNGKVISKDVLEIIEKEGENFDGVKLKLISHKKDQEKIANLIEKSNRVWFKSKELVDEMEYWLKDDLAYSKEGLPTGVLNLYKLAVEVKYFISRDSKSIKNKAEREKRLAYDAAAIGVIYTENDERIEWVRTGELYERMALRLTDLGIQNAFFNTVIELQTQRKDLEKMLKIKGRAQLIFRLGYSDTEVAHSNRRPVDEVIF